MKKILILSLLLMVSAAMQAAYVSNVPQTLVQPNGDTLHCFASGFTAWCVWAQCFMSMISYQFGLEMNIELIRLSCLLLFWSSI